MTRVMRNDTSLARFCTEHFGTVKTASEILDVPYQTLRSNCRRPTRGWQYLDKILERFMTENDSLKEKIKFLNEQYAHLADEYNKLVRKYEEATEIGEVL